MSYDLNIQKNKWIVNIKFMDNGGKYKKMLLLIEYCCYAALFEV